MLPYSISGKRWAPYLHYPNHSSRAPSVCPSPTLAATAWQPWIRSISLDHTSQFWAEHATTSSEVCLRHHQEWLDCALKHSACDQNWLANMVEALGSCKGNPIQPSRARKKLLWQLAKGKRRDSSLRTGEQGGTQEVFCSFILFHVTKLAENFQDARKVCRKLVFRFKMNYKAPYKIDEAASGTLCIMSQFKILNLFFFNILQYPCRLKGKNC